MELIRNKDIADMPYYRHFKGMWYKVLCLAKHTETKETMVVYQALYGEKETYVRPLGMFEEEVPTNKDNPTGQKYRFENIEDLNLDLFDVSIEIKKWESEN